MSPKKKIKKQTKQKTPIDLTDEQRPFFSTKTNSADYIDHS